MISFKILQYNTDCLRHGWEYFEKNLKDAELVVLQRFPKTKLPDLLKQISGGRGHFVESCTPHENGLVIAHGRSAPPVTEIEEITLPSFQHVVALNNPWQGCTALRVCMSGINLVSFLPCFKTCGDEFPITIEQTKHDIEFILNKFKDTPTIIFGDFHFDPSVDWLNQTLDSYKFKSHLDKFKTFRKTKEGDELINLDKCISNINIELENITVDDTPKSVGHMAIRYILTIVETV